MSNRSGKSILNRTASEIITKALRKGRIIPVRQPVSPTDLQTGLDALNDFMAFLRSEGWNLWKQKEIILFLEKSKQKYFLGPDGDRATCEDDLIATTVLTSTPANETSIELTSVEGLTGADNILGFNPTASTAGWTTNNATLSSIGPNELQVETTVANGYAQFQKIDTVTDRTYIFQVNLTDTSTTALIEIFSGNSNTLLASGNFAASGSEFEANITFSSLEDSVILRITPTGAGVGETVDWNSVKLLDTTTGEQLGFKVNDSLREWNVVTRLGPGANTVQLLNTTQNESSSGQSVFAYKTGIERPLKLRNYRARDKIDNNDIPVRTWTREQYFRNTIKDSEGLPTKAYFNPTLDDAELYIWQVASDVDQNLRFTANLPIQLVFENIDTPDFPDEWTNLLVWNLAAEIGPEYGVPDNRQAVNQAKADRYLDSVLGWDEEQGSLHAVPNQTGRA